MRGRAILKFQPVLEPIERKQLLSSGALSAHAATEHHTAELSGDSTAEAAPALKTHQVPTSFLVYRITNPKFAPVNLTPPFQQVLVQAAQPVPGQTYNVLYIAVKNNTKQTFTASNDFTVTAPGNRKLFPILTGTETWKPRKFIVFYVLTKQYYPFDQVRGGFEMFLGGRRSTLVPGPSGIFLRLKYNPATFANTLNWIVAFGQGAQLGTGPRIGMPDTAINVMVAARTYRTDYGGHF